MTLTEFNRLDDLRKLNIVWKQGLVISISEDKIFQFVVYEINDFFVDVKYNKDLTYFPTVKTFTSEVDISGMLMDSN